MSDQGLAGGRKKRMPCCWPSSRVCPTSSTAHRVVLGAIALPGADKAWVAEFLLPNRRARLPLDGDFGIVQFGRRNMQGFTARVKYRKNGLVRFIGHLDTVRTLLRAIRRAGIEATYSRGFSPRLRLSFGPPLPLGFTSRCEHVDIRLARKCEPETVKRKMQANLPTGLFVEDVQILEGKPPPLQTAFWAVEYEIEIPRHLAINRQARECVAFAERLPADGPCKTNILPKSVGDSILRASLEESDTGQKVLSVVLRQDACGGRRTKEVIADLLGIEREQVQKLMIHKKRVFSKEERW